MKATVPLPVLTGLLTALSEIRDECRPILGSDQNPNKGTIRRIDQLAADALREADED